LAHYPDYRLAYEKYTRPAFIDRLESAAIKRAVDGIQKLVITKSGDPVLDPRKHDIDGTVKPEWAEDPWLYETQYSDRILELLLRAKRPDEFRDRISQEVSGPGGSPVEVDAAVRQLVIANPDLSGKLCLAMENVIEYQSGISGGNGDAALLGVDDQSGEISASEASGVLEPQADGSCGWTDLSFDDLLSAPPREERIVQQASAALVSGDVPGSKGDADKLRGDVCGDMGEEGEGLT
jgi:hypothetical protein